MEQALRGEEPSDNVPDCPPVVVVVVTHDPGDWLGETFASLARQDHPDLRTVIVDTSTSDEAAAAVAGEAAHHLPAAEIHRLPPETGFGAAANEVLRGGCAEDRAREAGFFLFCHDDVALDASTVRGLVETAVLCSAGVVGPKLVAWDDPRWILQVGESVSRTAAPVALVERGEIDQGQHDGVREVFAVPGGVTLVHARLFRRIGGFDEAITWSGDSTSLCWRARLAGARVVVASAGRARHREALGRRVPEPRRQALALRHRLRLLLTCYGRRQRWVALPAMAVLSVLGGLAALVSGQPGRVGHHVAAWCWNLVRLRSVWIARRQVRRFRRVGDDAIRSLQVTGLLRAALSRRRDRVNRRVLATVLPGGRTTAPPWTGGAAMVGCVLTAVLLMGSRHLLTRGVPHIGQLVPFEPPGDLLHEWATGWRRTGLGSDAPVPTLHAALAGLGTVLGGHMGLLRTLLTAGLIPAGAIGAFRALRYGSGPHPVGTPRTAVGAAVAYAALPLPFEALGAGRWDTLAVYAAAPWLMTRLAGAGSRRTGTRPGQLAAQALSVGLLTGLLALVVPAAPVLLLLLAGGLALGSLLAFQLRPIGPLVLVAGGGALIATLLHLPWSLASAATWVGSSGTGAGWWGLTRDPSGPVPATLPLGLESSPALWALLGAALLPLLVGRAWRLTWAIRGWSVAAGLYALVWADQQQVPPIGRLPLPDSDQLLVLAGAGLALVVGCGVAAVEHDVAGRSRALGLRRLATATAAVALVGAAAPTAGRAVDGWWGMPRSDFGHLLERVDEDVREVPSRVLWVGRPEALPGDGWALDGDLAYMTSRRGTPRVGDLLPGPPWGATGRLAVALQEARSGGTARLGRDLAPMAVRYVAVPLRSAPSAAAAPATPPPTDLVDGLASQLDLERVAVDAALVLYRNTAFVPATAAVPAPGADAPGELGAGGGAVGLPSRRVPLLTGDAVTPVLSRDPGGRGMTRARGPVEGGTVVVQSVTASDRWTLEVDGVDVARTTAFGWANAFDVAAPGTAELRYDTPWHHHVLLAIQVGAWLAAVAALVGQRGRARRRIPADPADLAGADAPPAPAPEPPAPVAAPVRAAMEVAPDPRWIRLPDEDREYVRVISGDRDATTGADEGRGGGEAGGAESPGAADPAGGDPAAPEDPDGDRATGSGGRTAVTAGGADAS